MHIFTYINIDSYAALGSGYDGEAFYDNYGCISVPDYQKPLGCSVELNPSLSEYEETCICDTHMCNNEWQNLDIGTSCFEGDYDISVDLGEAMIDDTNTIKCYTNRDKCFSMTYTGTF